MAIEYSKKEWAGSELITASDLNKFENGIDNAINFINATFSHITNENLDNIQNTGFYTIENCTIDGETSTIYGYLLVIKYNSNRVLQILFGVGGATARYRVKYDTWQAWKYFTFSNTQPTTT